MGGKRYSRMSEDEREKRVEMRAIKARECARRYYWEHRDDPEWAEKHRRSVRRTAQKRKEGEIKQSVSYAQMCYIISEVNPALEDDEISEMAMYLSEKYKVVKRKTPKYAPEDV